MLSPLVAFAPKQIPGDGVEVLRGSVTPGPFILALGMVEVSVGWPEYSAPICEYENSTWRTQYR